MTTYDPAVASQLIAEAREDGGTMLAAFREFGDSHLIRTKHGAYGTHDIVTALERIGAMTAQLEAAKVEIERLRSLWGSTPLSVTAVAFENQHQRERVAALEIALREACSMLRGCRTGDNQPSITTSKIDALLAVANKDLP